MSRNSIRLLAIAFLLLASTSGRARAGDPIDDLGMRYKNGVIFVAASTILDIETALEDARQRPRMIQLTPPIDEPTRALAFDVLGAFLGKMTAPDQRIAVIQVDFRAGSAGYMLLGQLGGSMQDLNWSALLVRQVALIIDKFITEFTWSANQRTTIRKGTIQVGQAWTTLKVAEDNPFLPVRQRSEMIQGFRTLIENKPQEVNDLAKKDPGLHRKITSFQDSHDRALKALDSKFDATVPGYEQFKKDPTKAYKLEQWGKVMDDRDSAILGTFQKSIDGPPTKLPNSGRKIESDPTRYLLHRDRSASTIGVPGPGHPKIAIPGGTPRDPLGRPDSEATLPRLR